MNDFIKEAVSLSLVGKCVAAVVEILFIHATFRVLEQTLPRRFGRADARYGVRRFVVFCGYLSILLMQRWVMLEQTPGTKHGTVGGDRVTLTLQ